MPADFFCHAIEGRPCVKEISVDIATENDNLFFNNLSPQEAEALQMSELQAHEFLTPWICQISRLSMLFVGREMARLGFGPGQFFFLAELYRKEGLSQDELSCRVGVDKSNTSRALAKLERYGLIRREGDPTNHRIKKIYLQPTAHEIKNEFIRIQQRWNAELLNGLPEEKQAEMLSMLKNMTGNAEAFFRAPKPFKQPEEEYS
jgi:DNA-binding MarR family transcriptional regulator